MARSRSYDVQRHRDEDSDGKEKTTPLRRLLMGFLLSMISNLLVLAANYSIRIFDLHSSEVIMLIGLVGTVFYGTLVILDEELLRLFHIGNTAVQRMMPLLFTLNAGVGVAGTVAAVKLMPMGDLVVLKFSSPIPTYILSICFLKEPLYLSKFVLCALIVLGNVLVVRPPMIFGHDHGDPTVEYPYYWIGVLIGSIFSVSFAINSILIKKMHSLGLEPINYFLRVIIVLVSFTDVTSSQLMFMTHLGVFLSFFVTLAMEMPNRFFFSTSGSFSVVSVTALLGTVFAIIANFLMVILGIVLCTLRLQERETSHLILANAVGTPLLFVSVKNLEIPLVMAVEALAFSNYPSPMSGTGTALLTLSVFALTFHEVIYKKVSTWLDSGGSEQRNE